MCDKVIFERQFTSWQAMNRIKDIFSKLGLSIVDECIEVDFLASHLTVEDGHEVIASGSGKGVHHRIGAMAECLEHYLTETYLAEFETCRSSHEIADQDVLKQDGIIQSLRGFLDCETPVVSMRLYLDDSSSEVMVPHILINPAVANVSGCDSDANGYLSRYSSNTGTAFGLTESEAILHALMECIERHTQSELFLSMIGQINSKFFLFDKNKTFYLPPFRELLRNLPSFNIFAQAAAGGTWFFLASEAYPRMRLCEFGAGCSLSLQHALERSITEYAQCIGLTGGLETDEDRRAHRLFDELPGLRRLETLAVNNEHFDDGCFIRLTSLAELLGNHTQNYDFHSPDELLGHCVDTLDQEGRPVIYKVNSVGESGYIARVYVPGFNRFHLIRSGLQVAPNHVLL